MLIYYTDIINQDIFMFPRWCSVIKSNTLTCLEEHEGLSCNQEGVEEEVGEVPKM